MQKVADVTLDMDPVTDAPAVLASLEAIGTVTPGLLNPSGDLPTQQLSSLLIGLDPLTCDRDMEQILNKI